MSCTVEGKLAILQLERAFIVSANKSKNGQVYMTAVEVGTGQMFNMSGSLAELEQVPVGKECRVTVSGRMGAFERAITVRDVDALECKVFQPVAAAAK